MASLPLLITCPRGLENLLAEEAARLGLLVSRCNPRGVFAEAEAADIHRFRLWSRLANRIFLILGSARQADRLHLLEAAERVDWSRFLTPGGAIWIQAHGIYGELKHTGFTAQVLKDGINDSLRRRMLPLPVLEQDAAVHHLQVAVGKETYLLLDLLGHSLHQRGYRTEGGAAPLKENLAAAILQRAGWPGDFDTLVDPLCGSGTLLIEAAMMALDIAPGLLQSFARPVDPLIRDPDLCAALVVEARARQDAGRRAFTGRIRGFDHSGPSIAMARRNIQRAGLDDFVQVEEADARQVDPPAGVVRGLLLANPPYGERLGEEEELVHLYQELGVHWKARWSGWRLGVFTAQEQLARAMALTPERIYRLYNGPLAAQLGLYPLHAQPRGAEDQTEPDRSTRSAAGHSLAAVAPPWSEAAQMFANRLRKNHRKRLPWVTREGLEAWRLYDADLPEYAVAIDLYRDHALVQEYAPPRSVDPEKATARLRDIMQVVPEVLGIPRSQVILKQRQRQKGKAQYEKLAALRHEFEIREHGARLLINLHDYLDTGLFLDHRPTRRFIQQRAVGKRFLNLFCYTGAATVHAILGGAKSSVSVDLSQTYLDWAARNLHLNGVATGAEAGHELVRADVMEWLARQRGAFDLVFVDPPTFSNSKRMDDVFDVQRDHVRLLELAMARLSVAGLLIFSTNFRKFVLDPTLSERYLVEDVTASSIPEDFGRDSRIHRCWHLRRRW